MFSWREEKRLKNIEERGVDFRRAIMIFKNPVVEAIDARKDYGEERWRALGHVDDEYYMVAYTWIGDVRHIITAWKVDDAGRRRYEAILTRPN